MAKFPTYEEMGKKVAEEALDEFLYDGKSIREWMQIIASKDAISRQAVLDVTWEEPSYTDALNVLTEVRDKVKALPPINPQKPCEDAISRKEAISIAGIATLSVNQVVAALKKLPSVSSSEKPNKSEWQHDHEILKAYSDGASAVLESIKYLIEQYEHYLELLDADMKDGSATIVTKTKYAVYTEVVEQLKEVLESEDKA